MPTTNKNSRGGKMTDKQDLIILIGELKGQMQELCKKMEYLQKKVDYIDEKVNKLSNFDSRIIGGAITFATIVSVVISYITHA